MGNLGLMATLVLPNQLFEENPALSKDRVVLLVEDPLFFKDAVYPLKIHKQKLVLHRASMKSYEASLQKKGYKTRYVEWADAKKWYSGIKELFTLHPVDFMVEKRLKKLPLKLHLYPNPLFLKESTLKKLKHYSFTPFYIEQRKRWDILIDPHGKPEGGHWTYDVENRKKAPKGMLFPSLPKIPKSPFVDEALIYVEKHFHDHVGSVDSFNYPIDHKEAKRWLQSFIQERLKEFGPLQDAIVSGELSLMHSLLSSSLNTGLLTPQEVIDEALRQKVPIASLEGFIRQVMGWREFIRDVYVEAGVEQRLSNFWKHSRKMPKAFYEGTTGILPVDETIKKVEKHAYCHHIERLMVLGSFMLLCEIDPTEVYRWFMEFFIDAYDWVMVPNVYGMSQYADGGLMTTKPYICSSNYILNMSNYPKGEWCAIWDALFWRFMKKHRSFFEKQPRLGLLCRRLDTMDSSKFQIADQFLKNL